MPKLFDRVKVNIATTGTGTVTFGSVSSNAFLTPTEAGCVDGDTVRYFIVDGTDFEEGVGTIAGSVATMARTTVTKSKIAGVAGTTKLNLSGTAVSGFTAAAADIVNTANNLSDLASAPTALTNLGGTTVGKALFTAADAAAARTAAGVATGAAASKSNQQTGTDNTVAVTPAHQQDHDSSAKAWAYLTQSAGTYTNAAGYNIASITKNSTGIITVTFTTAFASTVFALIATLNQSAGVSFANTIQEILGSRTASSVQLQLGGTGSGGAAIDSGFSIVAFGRQ